MEEFSEFSFNDIFYLNQHNQNIISACEQCE